MPAFGLDVSNWVIGDIKRRRPGWNVTVADSLSALEAWPGVEEAGASPLILMNPPFSCRGNCVHRIGAVTSSAALAFVLRAAERLPTADIVALLPTSTIDSARDQDAWINLRARYDVLLVDRFGRQTFPDSSAMTAAVLFKPRGGLSVVSGPPAPPEDPSLSVILVRGSLAMHLARANPTGRPLVHTTNLRGGAVHITDRRVDNWRRAVSGPVVFIPRVGAPSAHKICHANADVWAISDCVMALCCRTDAEAAHLCADIVQGWAEFWQAYVGAFAPYLMVDDLIRASRRLRVDATLPTLARGDRRVVSGLTGPQIAEP